MHHCLRGDGHPWMDRQMDVPPGIGINAEGFGVVTPNLGIATPSSAYSL